jgi:hypothetical protein
VDIVQVRQGGTVYVKNVDYKLTAGQVDWSPAGAEPAPGSSYEVVFLHLYFSILYAKKASVLDRLNVAVWVF